ncbi:MAG: hypothetical protein AAB509_02880 [Patescibacteria group bacterium]
MKPLSEKVLLLLFTGLTLSICYTQRQYWKTIKSASREWEKINRKELQYEIKKLYRSRLIEKKENSDGSITMFLTDRGKLRALNFRFEEMKISEKNWDGKWRMVAFDVPEKFRGGRDALRGKIKKLGFYELQKSVFVFPYNCKDEIDFIIEFFNIRKYTRFALLETIDNEKHLKKIFNLT